MNRKCNVLIHVLFTGLAACDPASYFQENPAEQKASAAETLS